MSYKLISNRLIIIVPIIFLIMAFIRIYINYNDNKMSAKKFISEQSRLIDSLYMTHRSYYQSLYLNRLIPLNEDTLLGLPAYSASEISKEFSKKNLLNITMHTVSDRARNPKNSANKYELKAIKYFNKNVDVKEYFHEERGFYQYATPLRIERKCLKCHGKRENAPKFISQNYDKAYDYKIGELRGILSIKVPTAHIDAIFRKQFFASLIYDFILVSIVLLISFYLVKYFSKLQINLEEELDDRTNELQNSLSFLESYKEAIDSNLMVTKTDLVGKITYVNDNFCKTTGYQKSDLIGANHSIIRDKTIASSFYKKMWNKITSKETWHGRIRNIKKDGSTYWVDSSITPILDAEGNICEYISIRHDITQLIQQKNELNSLATIDSLTSLKNRNALGNMIDNNSNLSLILINIDAFSEINDFYGHQKGDKILVEFADKLRKICEENDNVSLYRVSGDEFAILLRERAAHIVVNMAQEISKLIGLETFEDEAIELSITTSISFEEKQHLLITADMALKVARREAKSLIVYDKSMSLDAEYENNVLWTKKIKDAIKHDRVVVFFQPIVNNRDEKINRYESLIRIIDEDGKVISPFFFLEIARKAKLYKQLTKIVIQKSFEAFRENDLEFSINLNIDDILDREINDYIIEMLEIYNISNRVIFEIVESQSIENFDEIQKFINSVKEIGCRIAIDDFGTGYSNFEYLMRLEPDFIKIDGSIVKEILYNKNSEILISIIVDFAKKMDIEVIAEFVESDAIFQKVKGLGIHKSQGYYFSEPKPTLN